MATTVTSTDYAAVYGITREFLEIVLSQGGQKVTVTDFKVTLVSGGKGDNFTGTVLGCSISSSHEGGSQHHDVVVKCPYPFPESRKAMLYGWPVYRKEVYIYSTVLPKMLEVEQERLGWLPIIPAMVKYYYSCMNEDMVSIVLQDERPQMFKMADKREGLDLDHCRLVLRELAKLHSLSYMLKDKYTAPGLRAVFSDMAFRESVFSVNRDGKKFEMVEVMCYACLNASRDTILASSEANENVRHLARSLEGIDIWDVVHHAVACDEPFAVICHGDMWANNALYKYDDSGKPVDIRLIDFQCSRYASPASDLAFFLFTSLSATFRNNHQEELLKFYHTTLTECLTTLGVSIPEFTLGALTEMYKRASLFGLIICAMEFPLMFGDKDAWSEELLRSSKEAAKLMSGIGDKLARVSAHPSVIEKLVGVFQYYIELTGKTSVRESYKNKDKVTPRS